MKTSMKDKVLSEIEKRHVEPISKERVMVERSALWAAVLFAVVLSALFMTFLSSDYSEFVGYGRGYGFSPFPIFFWLAAAA